MPAIGLPTPATGVKFTITLRDYEGKQSVVAFYGPYDQLLGVANGGGNDDEYIAAMAQVLEVAIGGASNNQVVQVAVTVTYGFSAGIGTNAPYESAEDKAILIWKNTATGDVLRTSLAGPPTGMFLADLETVDPTNLTITALTGAINASVLQTYPPVSTKDGVPSIAVGNSGTWNFERGYLVRGKTRRRFIPGWSKEMGGD